jgi:hypothetical protein
VAWVEASFTQASTQPGANRITLLKPRTRDRELTVLVISSVELASPRRGF